MSTYMLLLRGDTTQGIDRSLSPAEVQAILERYIEWSTRVEADGRFVAADKLRPEPGRTLRSEGGTIRVMDGPFSEAKEVVAGYFVIKAADLDEAERVARGCPHLDYGGAIELREIEPRVRDQMEDRLG